MDIDQLEKEKLISKFCEYMDWNDIIEMGLEFPITIIFDPAYSANVISPNIIKILVDSGEVCNIIPGVWWINGGKQKLILDCNFDQHFPITGTLDGNSWTGLLELVSLLM